MTTDALLFNENPTQEGTVISGWVVAIERALEDYQIKGVDFFQQYGLDMEKAKDANSRFPVAQISNVLRGAVKETNDENFGLVVAKFVRPTSWHALGISILASNNLKETFERFVRYRHVFYTPLEIDMQEDDGICSLGFSFSGGYQTLLTDTDMDAIIATFILTGRHQSSVFFTPTQVKLRRQQPAVHERFNRFFHCPIEFGANENRVFFETSKLNEPLLTANNELAMLSDRLTQEYLSRLNREDIINQVHLKLYEILGREIPNQKKIAQSLHMSERTLQRKLKKTGSSYQEVLDQLRQDMSLRYLKQTHLSINQISYLLGFSKMGCFTRAFIRWSGQSPSRYRKGLIGKTNQQADGPTLGRK